MNVKNNKVKAVEAAINPFEFDFVAESVTDIRDKCVVSFRFLLDGGTVTVLPES